MAIRIEEAETYYSMGLFDEALSIYENILSIQPEPTAINKSDLDEKINHIKKEKERLEKNDLETFSKIGLLRIQKIAAVAENAFAIHDSAYALTELGLWKDALKEYKKLLCIDYQSEKIFPEFAECLLKSFSPSDVIRELEEILKDDGLLSTRKGHILFHIGLDMEKRAQNSLALELYRSAVDLDPPNEEFRTRLQAHIAAQSSGSKYDSLLRKKLVTTDQLQQALKLSKKTGKSVEFVLCEHFNISKEEIGQSLSTYYGCPFRTYDPEFTVPVELLGSLKKTYLLQELWVPLSWGKEGVEILVSDPRNLNIIDHIKALIKSKRIDFAVGTREDIKAFIKRFFDPNNRDGADSESFALKAFDMIPEIMFEEEAEEERKLEEVDEDAGEVVQLVDQVLVIAFRQNASDIHIEPSPITNVTTIRFRLDGVCQDYIQVPNSMARGLISRLKIMGNLDIAERRLPQDGKIKFKRKGVPPFELRLATIPVAGSYEQAVLRILAKAGAMKLDEMGLNQRNLAALKKVISQPYGLVLVVGPTGSGKTTSLHAALGHINKPGVKIWTAEDPVEISQPGLSQVEAKPTIGLDFARIMRAFLRADPDVIMIGEMRDHETASIGVEASLTGHLVFSTLHTNSAPETVTRLLDMGLNPLNFSDAFLGVMAQRLVRKLCTACREEYHPTEEEFNEIVTDYGKERFPGDLLKFGPDLVLYRSKGCEKCSDAGYKGRMGIHELMEGSPEMKRLIKKNAPTEVLTELAMSEGMTSLKQDGIIKAFHGLTDNSEIRRVTNS
ncbi:MAG: ATPase, T2SS/T4P/T4SS family [Pseudomonadota bacterium]